MKTQLRIGERETSLMPYKKKKRWGRRVEVGRGQKFNGSLCSFMP